MAKRKSIDRKKQRYIKKICEILKQENAIFLTMSFNDTTLNRTTKETRKRYIKNFLRNETALYIANIDYGTLNNREHYHAIVKANTLNNCLPIYYNIINKVNLKAYKYGEINAKFIKINKDADLKETAKRLYNHSIKETTRNNKIIVSRKEPNETEQLKRLKRFNNSLDLFN